MDEEVKVPMGWNDEPVCLALLVCERVVEDKRSGNKSVFTILRNLSANKFPIQFRCFVMATLTNLSNPATYRFVITSPSNEELARMEMDLTKPLPPTHVHDIVMEGVPILINSPGIYKIQLWTDDLMLAERVLLVRQPGE